MIPLRGRRPVRRTTPRRHRPVVCRTHLRVRRRVRPACRSERTTRRPAPMWVPMDRRSARTGRPRPRTRRCSHCWELPDRLRSRLVGHDAAKAVGAVGLFEQAREVRTAPEHLPAVDIDHLAGDPGRLGSQQKPSQCGDVVDVADPGERGALPVIVEQRAAVQAISDDGDEGRLDQPRSDRVDANVTGAQLVCRELTQVIHPRLDHAVRAEPPVGVARRDGRDRDEGSAAAANQLARSVFEREHGAREVQVQGLLPGFGVDLGDRRDRLAATGRGRDAVQPAGHRGGLRHGTLNVVFARHVGDDIAGGTVRTRGIGGEFLGRFGQAGLRAPTDGDVCARSDQERRDTQADPAPAAGNENRAPAQVVVARHESPFDVRISAAPRGNVFYWNRSQICPAPRCFSE